MLKYFMAVQLKLLQALLCHIDESFCSSPRQVQRQMEREKGRTGEKGRKAAEEEIETGKRANLCKQISFVVSALYAAS